MSEVIVLYDGFSRLDSEGYMSANCTCTLIKGTHNVIVDTMTPWDTEKIINGIKSNNLTAEDIDFVVSTHGHSDHTGNNNLFLKAKHIVGYSISFYEKYYLHPFDNGEEYVINDSVKVIPTPGHTLTDVSVLVTTTNGEKIAIAGDLFEKEEDISDPNIWKDAGSEDEMKQIQNRIKISKMADWIIPGHGRKFKVTQDMRNKLEQQHKFLR